MTSLLIQRLCNVQRNLMSKDIEDNSLNNLLHLIFEECIKENMTFYFNFIENQVVLNLCDLLKEHNELHFRLSYSQDDMISDNTLKIFLLENAFLLTSSGYDVASSVKQEPLDETPILSSDEVMPKSIRKAVEKIQQKGIPVTPEAIRNHLPLGQMSTQNRIECNRYLKMMEASK